MPGGSSREREQKKKFRFKNKLISLDSSVIDPSLSLFDWAQIRRTKGAVKLHLLPDHDGYLPSFAVITSGKASDIKVARKMSFDPGSVRPDRDNRSFRATGGMFQRNVPG